MRKIKNVTWKGSAQSTRNYSETSLAVNSVLSECFLRPCVSLSLINRSNSNSNRIIKIPLK